MAKLNEKIIIDFLKEKNVYADIDQYLVKEFLYNLELAELCRQDIEDNGIKVPINNDETLFSLNPSHNAYQTAIKTALTLSRKMGLDYRSRQELDMLIDADDDSGFDD